MTYRSYIFTAITYTFVTGFQANAQMPEPVNDDKGTGYIGVTGLIMSEYLGSDDQDFQVLPYLSFEDVKGFDFFGTSLNYRLFDEGTGQGFGKWSLRGGPQISYQPGRDSDDSPILTGFDDIDGSLPLGGYVFGTLGPVGLRVDAGQDIAGGHDGLTIDTSIGTAYRSKNIGIQPSVTVSWADHKFHDSFFGVNSAQAASSGLNGYNPGSGIYGYSVNGLAWLEVKEKYAIVATASYRWFTDDAADSPILQSIDGSKNGFFAGLSLTRKFDTKNW